MELPNKKPPYIDLFKNVLSKLDITGYIPMDTITSLCPALKLGNGASWCRAGNKLCKEIKLSTIKNNVEIRHLFDATDEEKLLVENGIKHLKFEKKNSNKIEYIRILPGKNLNIVNKIIPSTKIKKVVIDLYNKTCIYCGSKNDICIDHKDDEYITKELTYKDFQVLCQHCNTVKRSGSRINRIDKELPPFLEPIRKLNKYIGYDPKYIKGENTNISRFWYDPKNWIIEHTKEIIHIIKKKYKKILQLEEILKEKKEEIKYLKNKK